MWFLFHRKSGTQRLAGGETFVEKCPTCERETRFEEVECVSKYGVWFVDVVDDSERAFRCTRCGDTFDRKEHAPAKTKPAPAAAPSVSGMQRVEQLAAEQRRRDAEAAKNRAKIETRIDDELAELKRRMGR